MASFIKKLVDGRNRSKSPTKQVSSPQVPSFYYGPPPPLPNGYYQMGTYQFGTLPRPPHSHHHRQDSAHINEYSPFPATLLPLPPSPLTSPGPMMRNNSRHSTQHSNQSNESLGIQSWNTEKSEPPRPENWKEIMKPRTIEEEDPYCFDHNSNFATPIISGTISSNGRARSHSPRKEKRGTIEEKPSSRSKSPQKKRAVSNTLDYLNSQCHLEGCSVALVVHSTRFLICRHQLCHASEYFKTMLLTHRRHEDIYVAVSGMNHPPPTTQFRWFIESCIPCPALKDIEDDTLETCMRLSKRFQASGLEVRCAKYIIENACHRQPIVALCWLNWSLKHKFEHQTVLSCLPCVARLSLANLEQHRHMMSERVFADILAAKLRGCYEKAVHVFRTIHKMDHFSVDVDRCPRCNRTREGMRVRVNADPCRKQIGCDRCHQPGCEIENKAGDDLQAFYQCSHALLPLNDTTDECHCQTRSLAIHLGAAYPPRQLDIPIPLKDAHREKLQSTEKKNRSRQKVNSHSEN